MKHKNLLHIKMGKEILAFGNIETGKKLTTVKVIFLKDVDIEKVLLSSKISFGKNN